MTGKSYDQKCYDLAEAFLEDEPHLNNEKNRDELAQDIQRTIEGFIAVAQADYEPSDAELAASVGPSLQEQQMAAYKIKRGWP